MGDQYSLRKHKLGFFEIHPKPSAERLAEHYKQKYFQEASGSYSLSYTDAEKLFFSNQGRLCELTLDRHSACEHHLLDIGCGEGFFSSYFHSQGWDIDCIDYSQAGISRQNPQLLPFFKQGDIFETLDELIDNKKRYGLLNLDNVLEHVLEPIDILHSMKCLMTKTSIARIEVPNDFSAFQELLVNLECTEKTWVAPPDHLTYFNKDSFLNILTHTDLEILSLQADYPIEQFLLNPHSNYWRDRSLGKDAHMTRVICTNYLIEQNINRFLDYSEAAADLEFGRTLTAYVRLKTN